MNVYWVPGRGPGRGGARAGWDPGRARAWGLGQWDPGQSDPGQRDPDCKKRKKMSFTHSGQICYIGMDSKEFCGAEGSSKFAFGTFG